jgi:hypothetical protein
MLKMPTALTLSMPHSMRPWFSRRVAVALTALVPVHPAVLAHALSTAGVTPDRISLAYTKHSTSGPKRKTLGIVHLIYADRDYYFKYTMKKCGQFTIPAYIAPAALDSIRKELTAWLPVYTRPPTFLERLLRAFAFRDKLHGLH